MGMARPLSIAIVGAGMGGLAAAAALRRVGIDVTVYEQATQFARLGAGIQIGCNAMKVLRGLGLEARLRAQSFYPRSWNNRDWRTGEIKFDMIFGERAEQKFGAPYLLAHRGDLHAALASAVPDECIRLNHKLVGLDESGEGVRLTFANCASAIVDRNSLERWGNRNVTLLGDACHPMTPYMAQGAAMAIEDAAVLSRCLDGVERDGVANAFRRFEATRKERTARIQETSRANTWLSGRTDTDWVYGYDAWTAPLAA